MDADKQQQKAIQRVVDAAFKNMAASLEFQNLNCREQALLRDMIFRTVMATVSLRSPEPSAPSSEVAGELKGIRALLEGLAKQGAGLVRSGQVVGEPMSIEQVEGLARHLLQQRMQTNLDQVKVSSGQAEGVGSAVDKLKKMQGG